MKILKINHAAVSGCEQEVMLLPSSRYFPQLYEQSAGPDCLSLGFMEPPISEKNHFLFSLCLPDTQAGSRTFDKK